MRGFIALLFALTTFAAAPTFAQTAGLNGPVSRDITPQLSAELLRACRNLDNTPITSACTINLPARVKVDGVLISGDMPPIIIDNRLWVEVSSLFNALSWNVSWDGVAQRVTSTRSDFIMQLTLGNRTVNRKVTGYSAPEFLLDVGMSPFVSTPRNRTMIPLAAVAELTGSEVDWNNAERTAYVTRGTPYFYDRKPDGSGADIMFNHMRYVGPGGSSSCAAGSSFDWRSRYCVDTAQFALGNFPELYRARARELGYPEANSNRWPIEKLITVIDSSGLRGRSTAEIIAEMESHTEIFGLPFDNHDISTPGMFSVTGGNRAKFTQSEATLPPFIMSGRRQTDQMVRTLYAMMPADIRENVAFLQADRVAQNPGAYLGYIRSKQRAVLVGSFKGARSITANTDPLHQALVTRHQRELFKLRSTLALLNSLGIPVSNVLYGMGDSKTTFANDIRNNLQVRFNNTLTAAGYANLVSNGAAKLSWGADELQASAFAKELPEYKVFVYASNPAALHVWDALANTETLLQEKIATMKLRRVNTAAEADLKVYILNREPGIGQKILTGLASPEACPTIQLGLACKLSTTGTSCTAGTANCNRVYTDDGRFSDRTYIGDRASWSADNAAQASHDQAFVSKMAAIPIAERASSIIIDARVPNGAWNKSGAPTSTDWLIYSGWGTFANNVGLAIAQAKVLHHARAAGLPINVAANSRRMLLEAVAHDVYANGYFEGQRASFETTHQSFRERLSAIGVNFIHQEGYSADNTLKVFTLLNTHVNEKMRAHFVLPAGSKLHVSAQFWRTFESEVHLYPVGAGELLTPGLYRTGTILGASQAMDSVLSPLFPSSDPAEITRITLQSVTN